MMRNESNYNSKLHQCTLYDFPHSLVHISREEINQPCNDALML